MPSTTFTPFKFLRRNRTWYIAYPDLVTGKQRQKATKYHADEEAAAERYLVVFIQKYRAKKLLTGNSVEGPMTVARWAVKWLADLTDRDIGAADDYRSVLKNHILPHIGNLRLDEVKREHIDQVMAKVKKLERAPRTQLHVYWTMKAMFNRAVQGDLLSASPCRLTKRDLPKLKDADPEWRDTALFSKAEIQALVTDERIPWVRRVFYALEFLTGSRFGEVSALRIRHYHPDRQPLGMLQVALSYSTKKKKVKGVKTDVPRKVPVHPWLADVLAPWLAYGWEQFMGRPPTPDDLMVPTERDTHRKADVGWRQLNGLPAREATPAVRGKPAVAARAAKLGDLGLLGFKRRRQHDARLSFITLAVEDGAIRHVLKEVTHGKEGTVMDGYQRSSWSLLCAQVSKLDIGPPAPPTPTIAAAPGANVAPANSAELLRQGLPQGCQVQKAAQLLVVTTRPQRDSNAESPTGQTRTRDDSDGQTAQRQDDEQPSAAPITAIRGRPQAVAILATLALRQVLAALDRGRLDEARAILLRAIKDEADERRGAAS
jgi:hypothetical protein